MLSDSISKRAERHITGLFWATALRPDPPKKASRHHRPFGGKYDEYRQKRKTDEKQYNLN